MSPTLPVVDIEPFLHAPDSEAGACAVDALISACRDPGFCYLIGHGVAESLNAEIMAVAKQFFELPVDERHRIAIEQSPHFRGYTILGDERTQGKPDWREQIDVGPEQAARTVQTGEPAWLRLRGPNQWPASLPQMRPAVLEWMEAVSELGQCAMRALAIGLGQSVDVFDETILPDPYNRVKIIRYPAPSDPNHQPQGLGLHHDSGLLSLILQDGVGGLQVQTNDGLIDATPMPGAFIMNLGEMLQIATNGFLRATKHQVTSPPPGNARISIAFFFNPRLDAVFKPLTLPPALAARATGGQNADPSDPVFPVFGENTLKIRMRAHPDVSARHYPDV